MVLATSINLDAIAIVGKATENTIELISEGYDPISVSVEDLNVNEKILALLLL